MYKNSRDPTGKIYNNYKNTRLKLLKTNAAIWFNKEQATGLLQFVR
jgi:hypothetical protein